MPPSLWHIVQCFWTSGSMSLWKVGVFAFAPLAPELLLLDAFSGDAASPLEQWTRSRPTRELVARRAFRSKLMDTSADITSQRGCRANLFVTY
jgi:hypothetical protein